VLRIMDAAEDIARTTVYMKRFGSLGAVLVHGVNIQEPRSSAASIRHRRKLYFVFPLSEVQRAYQAGLPDLQSFAQCSSAGRPAARSYRAIVQAIYTDLHIFGILRRSAYNYTSVGRTRVARIQPPD
jgi:hypothetical protein